MRLAHMCHLERSGASACGRAAESRDLAVVVARCARMKHKVPRLRATFAPLNHASLGMTVQGVVARRSKSNTRSLDFVSCSARYCARDDSSVEGIYLVAAGLSCGNQSAARSHHCGFIFSISHIFFSLRQRFSCFSRAIALPTLSWCSQ